MEGNFARRIFLPSCRANFRTFPPPALRSWLDLHHLSVQVSIHEVLGRGLDRPLHLLRAYLPRARMERRGFYGCRRRRHPLRRSTIYQLLCTRGHLRRPRRHRPRQPRLEESSLFSESVRPIDLFCEASFSCPFSQEAFGNSLRWMLFSWFGAKGPEKKFILMDMVVRSFFMLFIKCSA